MERKTGLGLAPAVTTGVLPPLGKQDCRTAICCKMKAASHSLIPRHASEAVLLFEQKDFCCMPTLAMAPTMPACQGGSMAKQANRRLLVR